MTSIGSMLPAYSITKSNKVIIVIKVLSMQQGDRMKHSVISLLSPHYKPNTPPYKPNTPPYKPNTLAYKPM